MTSLKFFKGSEMVRIYKLISSKTFLKDLKKIPPEHRSRVNKALMELKKDPFSARDLKKLANIEIGRWRLRIGDYRLRYDIIDQKIQLHIIRHCKDAYQKK